MNNMAVKIKGIVECQGKYLLVQKWYDDNIVNPYKWEFVDSMLEPGTRPEDAVLENVEAQTGLNTKIDKILYTWTYEIGETAYVGIAFLCKADDDIVILSDDYSNSIWVEPEKINLYIEDTDMLKDLNKYLGIKIDSGSNEDEDLELTL